MKLLLRFLKPHRKLFVLTVLLLFIDVIGALFIPTLAADMINAGTLGADFSRIVETAIQMGSVSLLAGGCAILGGYTCAKLTAQVGKDLRAKMSWTGAGKEL